MGIKMKKLFLGPALFCLALPFSGAAAQTESEKDDTTEPEKTAPVKKTKTRKQKFELKLKGKLWSGYEFVDSDSNGAPDSAGPTSETTGFNVRRAYVTVQGVMKTGEYKGWGFRITTDMSSAGAEGDGCGTSCSENNDYVATIKYAYARIPLPFLKGAFLHLGQQHSPVVDGKAGVSLQKYWGHRYIAKTTWEDIGLTSSTERGLAFLYKSKFLGAHLLLGNGEGYHKNNAQSISNTTLSALSAGSGDSYGLDLYGLVSLKPTGNAKDLQFSINFPFRLHNVYGVSPTESEYATADLSTLPAAPQATYLVGDTRAKRDISYGVEGDFVFKTGDFSFTIGGGTAVKVDRRNNAYQVDENGIDLTSPTNIFAEINLDRDRRGFANYIFAHARFGIFGAFGRYTIGTSGGSLSNKIGVVNNKSFLEQAVELDASDGTFGNLTLGELNNGISRGKGRFHNIILGISIHPTDFFTLSLGVSRLTGSAQTGKEFRVNPLERVQPQGSATANLSTQLQNENFIKNSLGYSSSESLDLNDFIGTQKRNQQVFIRTELKY